MRLPYVPVEPSSSSPSSSHPPTADTSLNSTAESDSNAAASLEKASAYATLSARRHPNPLLALDLTLLHSPPVAIGWSAFFGAIRNSSSSSSGPGSSLPDDIRELCICRVAVLNGATYEWDQHVESLRRSLMANAMEARHGPGGGQGQEEKARKDVEAAVEMVKTRKAWKGWDIRQVLQVRRGPASVPAPVPAVGAEEAAKGPGNLSEKQCSALAYCDAMTIGVKVSDEIFARLRHSFGGSESRDGGGASGEGDRAIVELTATVAGYNCVSRFLVALDVGEVTQNEERLRREREEPVQR